jgi:hypothetical protein
MLLHNLQAAEMPGFNNQGRERIRDMIKHPDDFLFPSPHRVLSLALLAYHVQSPLIL